MHMTQKAVILTYVTVAALWHLRYIIHHFPVLLRQALLRSRLLPLDPSQFSLLLEILLSFLRLQ